MLTLLTLLVTFVLTGTISFYHFKSDNTNYHHKRLERKESAIKSHLDYVLRPYKNVPLEEGDLENILAGKVQEITSIHHMDLAVYAPTGKRVAATLMYIKEPDVIPQEIIPLVDHKGVAVYNSRNIEQLKNRPYITSTSVIEDANGEPMAALVIPYFLDNSELPQEDLEFFGSLIRLYIGLFLLGVVFAYLFSNYLSSRMSTITEKLKKIRLNQTNEKLEWKGNDEMGQLVAQYNRMVDDLEAKAVELAQSERESAWKEMAKQVAHEIKNPLTPMRLTAQLLERASDLEEVRELSAGMVEQIDGMTNIAEAFSRFAQMPQLNLERIEIGGLVERTTLLYADKGVSYDGFASDCFAMVDKDQFIRILHNLIKNALQAVPEERTPNITVVFETYDQMAVLKVADNGMGIPIRSQDKVFEPNFTTKSSGMGLGLAMVKNIITNFEGVISFYTVQGKGTVFTVKIPLAPEE